MAHSIEASPFATLEDAGLAERAKLGDRDAFGELYDRLAPLLLRVATTFFPAGAQASDLVHDVFLEAWEHVRQYDPARGTVRSWLLLRLRSRALDRLGRAETRLTESLGDGGGLPVIAWCEPDRVSALAVRRALESLAPDVRLVLLETYVRGLSAREIAESVGVPVGTVKSRLARGLSLLSQRLGGEDGS